MTVQAARPARSAPPAALSLTRWTALCAAAEAIGMTAAATAAKTSQALVGEPGRSREVAVALALVVGGGLVEGVALGAFQAAGLRRLIPGLDTRRWVLITTAVAGVGWAAASAPGALAGPDSGSMPPLLLVLGGALALGAVMGTLLGAAQATGLLTHVRHPWRWIGASAAAWAPAMTVIFLGATTPEADWSGPAVVSLGTITGLAAGTVLGLVSGSVLPSLDGAPVHNRLVLRLLRSSMHRALSGSLVALRVRGVRTGRTFELPVQYAAQQDGLVVVPGRPESKRWWRNLVEPAGVEVLLSGHWVPGEAAVLRRGDPGHDTALAAYRDRWPKVRLPHDIPVVGVRFVPDRAPR